MNPKWTICIATCPPRARQLRRLMNRLLPQVNKYEGQIEILILFNNFEHSVGWIRQRMMEDARGEYISHIDDDDLVTRDFCDTIFPLLDGVDYVGFNAKLVDEEGKVYRPAYHTLKYDHWHEDDQAYYRGVVHICPLRTELARQSTFPEIDIGEDHDWTTGVRAKTEHYIDRAMYLYDNFQHIPMERTPVRHPVRPVYRSKYVRFHSESTNEKEFSTNDI